MKNKIKNNMTDDKKAIKALKEIQKTIDHVKDIFDKEEVSLDKDKKESNNKKQIKPKKTLKRVQGIIKNFNEDNAYRKLKHLVRFLDSISENDLE